MAGGTPTPQHPVTALRHRRNALLLTATQLKNFRLAITRAQAINDNRGFQFWAGIHGLPLPISCTHHSPLFLPWHRAYLYFFEKALQDIVPGVTLPWWDWTKQQDRLPLPYTRAKAPDGTTNPLRGGPIQPAGRETPNQTRTSRDPGGIGALPTTAQLNQVMANNDFFTFQTQLESLHDGVHVWTGGSMQSIGVAAYDPIFWAHHCMIDRAWYLWQIAHPGARPPANMLNLALAPFPMTVRETLDITQLGYDYAAGTTAAAGPGLHG